MSQPNRIVVNLQHCRNLLTVDNIIIVSITINML